MESIASAANLTSEFARATCPVEGNSDLYGLGIRISIYLQMLTVQISSMQSTLRDTDDALNAAAVIFILSVGTTLWQQIRQNLITAVEVAPVIYLLVGQMWVCRVPWYKNQLIMFIFMGESVCLISLNIWFWWKGIDTLPPSGCPDDYSFFFAKVSLYHWFRTFNKVVSIISGIGTYLGFLAYVASTVFYLFSNPRGFFRGTLIDNEQARQSAFSAGLNISTIVFLALTVELSIRWNKIQDVNNLHSTGQFMPLFISIAQFLSTIWLLTKSGLKILADEEEFLTETGDGGVKSCPHGNPVFQDDQGTDQGKPQQESGLAPSTTEK